MKDTDYRSSVSSYERGSNSSESDSVDNSYFNSDSYYFGSSTDAYDIRYTDDCHLTYGKQYEEDR